MTKRLLVMVLAVLGVVAFLPASATASPTAPAELRMAAVGIDVGSLRPGYIVVGDEAIWDNGDVVLGFGPNSEYDCPSLATCLFENANYNDQNRDGIRDPGTRMLSLKGRSVWHSLPAYSFNDKMSSWVNQGPPARWYENNLPNPTPAHCMRGPGSMWDFGFTPLDDKATMLWIYKPGELLC